MAAKPETDIQLPVSRSRKSRKTTDKNQIISLEPLLNPTSSQAQKTATSLLSAFRTSGFIYLKDYSSLVPPSTIETVFHHSAQFFARPQPQKDQLACASAAANRGYNHIGREKASQALTAEEVAKEREEGGEDMKETFEIGREGEEGNPTPWPDEMDEEGKLFKETMQEFFMRCKEMHMVLMRGIAMGMGLGATFFDDYVDVGDNNLRLLHYPATAPGSFSDGRMRAGAHSDYGSVTFLFQDQRGGLQVEKVDGSGWMHVEPRKGHIVVNAGDRMFDFLFLDEVLATFLFSRILRYLVCPKTWFNFPSVYKVSSSIEEEAANNICLVLARWSNDLIRSTRHRVVAPPPKGDKGEKNGSDGGHPPRYSVAYFCNPNFDRWIEALPGTWENVEGGKKYKGINSRDYLVSRLSATTGASSSG
ncbi:MAG: hypothetical protein Q9171_002893 [Xanthocarpia ochracea]